MAKKYCKVLVVWFPHPQVSAYHHCHVACCQNEEAFCHSVMNRPVTLVQSCINPVTCPGPSFLLKMSHAHFAPDQIASPRRPGPSKGPPPLESTDAQRAHRKAMYKVMQDQEISKWKTKKNKKPWPFKTDLGRFEAEHADFDLHPCRN